MSTASTVAGLAVVGAAALVVQGCGSADGSAPAPVPAPIDNTITGFSFSTDDAAAVTVDGAASTGILALGSQGRAQDPGVGGTEATYAFSVDSASTGRSSVTVVVNPAPDVLVTHHATVLKTARTSLGMLGFGASLNELTAAAHHTHAAVVERALTALSPTPAEPYPAWIDVPMLSWPTINAMSSADRNAFMAQRGRDMQSIKAWFLRQFATSPAPLTERLLLFWHNLFTTAAADVEFPQLVAWQHRLFREQHVGNLRTFLKAMTRDPGMCSFLDSSLNKKGKPNENFARELLELFTFGELTESGAYAESDILVVARAFTGYGLTAIREFQYKASDHDTDPKTLWGETKEAGADDGDWVIDRILTRTDLSGRNAVAAYLTTRLWREFIGEPTADDRPAMDAIAARFAGVHGFDLVPWYRDVLTTPAASDPDRAGLRFRSPIALYAVFQRGLGLLPENWTTDLFRYSALEQDPFNPPSVFGWPGGDAWITVKTATDRHEFMGSMAQSWRGKVPDSMRAVLELLLMSVPPVRTHTNPQVDNHLRDLLQDPAYQVG